MFGSNFGIMKLTLLWLFLRWGCVLPAQSTGVEWTPNTQRAYHEVLKLRLGQARALVATEPRTSAMRVYVENYADVAQLLISEDPSYYKVASSREDTRLELLKKLPENSPYRRFLQAEIHLQWAFVKLKFGHELSGCWNIIKAYRLLEDNHKQFPAFLPQQKSLGLLHVLFGATPKNYQWVTRLLGLRGDVSGGLQEIRSVVLQNDTFGPEAQLIELLLHSYVVGMTDPKLRELELFVKAHPDNLMFHLFGASMLLKNNQAERALPFLLKHPSGGAYLTVPSFEYLKGEALLQKGQYASAIESYKRYLELQKGHNFVKDAHYKIYLSYWLAGKEPDGRPYLGQVARVGKAITEPDKVAARFAERYARSTPSAAARTLMHARLAFDGGYYAEALEALSKTKEADFANNPDKAEYQYRLGRVYHKTNDLGKATLAYQRAIGLSPAEGVPFGATSALQLGYLCVQIGQKNKARSYFEQALTYERHEYKNSVDNKAKAALNELGY